MRLVDIQLVFDVLRFFSKRLVSLAVALVHELDLFSRHCFGPPHLLVRSKRSVALMENPRQSASARAPFCIVQFRPDESDTAAEERRKEVGVHSYFGFPSYAHLQREFENSFEPWASIFSNHERMTPTELLTAVEEARSGSKRARVAVREHSISSFDVFCLPFRCITRCETIEELSVDYGVGYFSSAFLN